MSKIFQLRSIHSMLFFLTYWQQSFHDAIMKFSSCLTSSSIPWFLNMMIMHGSPHDDVIKWKHFPRYWPYARWIHRSPVNSPHKGQWRGALMFTLICTRINGWVNNRVAGDLRRHRAHSDVNVMTTVIHMTTSWHGIFFPNCRPFVRGIHWSSMDSLLKEQQTWNFDVLFVVSLDKPLNKRSHCWWSAASYRSFTSIAVAIISRSRHCLSQKIWHFHKNTRSCVENECCCPRAVNISNVNFTLKISQLQFQLYP